MDIRVRFCRYPTAHDGVDLVHLLAAIVAAIPWIVLALR